MTVKTAQRHLRVRTLFISDVHLGFRGARAEYLVDCLDNVAADCIVVAGDLVDLWSLKRGFYWPTAHQEVLRRLLRLAREGTRVIYVPGNHDEAFRELCGAAFGSLEIRREYVHVAADGQRLLVVHGDEFDTDVRVAPLLGWLGNSLYDVIIAAGRWVHGLRRQLRLPYWSLATWIKTRVPDAMRYVERFEAAAAREASRRGLDGIVCGHIHRPQLKVLEGVLYCNAGDWVEHCTALVEDRNGRMALIRWADAVGEEFGAVAPAPAFDTAA